MVVVAAVVDSSKNGTFYFLGQVITITFLSRSKIFLVFFEHDTGLKVQLHNWKVLFVLSKVLAVQLADTLAETDTSIIQPPLGARFDNVLLPLGSVDI